MTDIVLKDVDPILAERIRRGVSGARLGRFTTPSSTCWNRASSSASPKCAAACDDREVNALADAISALKDVPPGKGF